MQKYRFVFLCSLFIFGFTANCMAAGSKTKNNVEPVDCNKRALKSGLKDPKLVADYIMECNQDYAGVEPVAEDDKKSRKKARDD